VLVGLAAIAVASALDSFAALAVGALLAATCYVAIWRRLKPVPVVAMPTPGPAKASAALALLDVLAILSLWK